VLTLAMVTRMLAKAEITLDDLVAELPECHKTETIVKCPADRKGAVMRAVSERASGMDADMSEGVRVRYSDGWALVLPDASEPTVTVWAEAATDDAAKSRAAQWVRTVQDAITSS